MLFPRQKKSNEEGKNNVVISRKGHKNTFLTGLLLFCLFLPLLIFTAGCWDRREPSLLGVVSAVGYDYDPQTEMLQVIAQVANPLGVAAGDGGQNGGGSGENAFWVVETSGHTVYEAVKKMEQVSTRKLIWSHLEVVLFSETLAREGILPILDYVDRERQVRLIARPFVVQGDVRQLLEAEFPLEELSGPALLRQFSTLRMEDAFTPEIDSLRRLFHHLTAPGVELILPRIEVQVEKEEAEGGEKSSGGGSSGGGGAKTGAPNPAKISGSALFRGDKLVGFFDEKETAGYLWLTDNIRRLTMVFPPRGEKENEKNKFLTVEVFWASTKLKPEVQGEKVRMRLSVYAEGRMQDFAGQSLPLVGDFKDSLNRRMATVIHNQIGVAWQKSQELKLDVLGFGHELYKTKPQDWKRLEKKWKEIFPQIELEVEVEAIIRHYGLVTDPIKIR